MRVKVVQRGFYNAIRRQGDEFTMPDADYAKLYHGANCWFQPVEPPAPVAPPAPTKPGPTVSIASKPESDK